MAKEKQTQPNDDIDEGLKQIFRDILSTPAKRREAFRRLENFEAVSSGNVFSDIVPPKKKARSKKSDPPAEMVRTVLALYKDYQTEIQAILDIGGKVAMTLITLLAQKKGRKLPPKAD